MGRYITTVTCALQPNLLGVDRLRPRANGRAAAQPPPLDEDVARLRVDGVLHELRDGLARSDCERASQRMRSNGSAGRRVRVRAEAFAMRHPIAPG